MKLIIFLLSIITGFQQFISRTEKLRFLVREINIDTTNFRLNVLEKNDLSFLIQISNPTNRNIVLHNKDSLKFEAWFESNKGTSKPVKMNVFFSPVFRQDDKGRNPDLVVKTKGKSYFVIGLSCWSLSENNRNYVHLTKAEKLNYLLALANNIKISYGSEFLSINKKQIKTLYRPFYSPHDPDKPYPLYPKPIIIK